jgi:hypothetical protein
MALISCLYNIVHYLCIPTGYRAKFNSIVEILRTDVLILIIFYYVRCASEEIFRRKTYLIYKKVIAVFFLFMNGIMISGGIIIFLKLENNELSSTELCRELVYLSFKWGPAISSFIFLILSIHLQMRLSKIHLKYRKKLIKRSLNQSSFKRVFS